MGTYDSLAVHLKGTKIVHVGLGQLIIGEAGLTHAVRIRIIMINDKTTITITI